ncbi:MAG TPA: SAM-dependent methyltransferase [Candidatus Angelobacter sp.]|nr:SAM-dependent methyltransferase [Candidatus Angelobacter sp.]
MADQEQTPSNPIATVPRFSEGKVRALETSVPLSHSVIWRLQHDYYVQRGLKAWTEDMVPSYITNNPLIAEIYAGIMAGFLEDCMGPARRDEKVLSPECPLRIVELGAGTGKFSFLLLRKLTALLRARRISAETLRYCMADCSEALIAEWQANPSLKTFVEDGVLEFKQLQIGAEAAAIPAHWDCAPLVIIANYFFDSLPQDAFMISNGQISESMVTTSAAAEGTSLSGLQLSFNTVPALPDRYAEKSWNAILEEYRTRLTAATVYFPTAALALLQRFSSLSDGRMLVLAADKGFTHIEDLELLQGPPTVEFHAGSHCFSQVVNFEAISRYYAGKGGEALLPQKHISSLNICAFLERSGEDGFPITRKAYREVVDGFGPDDLFTLMGWLDAHLHEVSAAQALAILRLTRWDPTALMRLFPVVAPQLRTLVAERLDLRDAVFSVMANHFPVSRGDNELAFDCGVILLELRFFAEAMEMFTISEQALGPSAATSYNLGLCSAGLGRSEEALAFMVKACDQDPAFAPAQSARARLEGERKPG